MSEMQPPEGDVRPESVPPAEGNQERQPQVPPASQDSPASQVPPSWPPTPKRRLVWWAAALGFITPIVGVVLAMVVSSFGPVPAVILGYGSPAIVLVAFVVGVAKPNDALRSFGVGGLVAYGVVMLVGLLLFGACVVTLGSQGI
jgi:hypothetical protein